MTQPWAYHPDQITGDQPPRKLATLHQDGARDMVEKYGTEVCPDLLETAEALERAALLPCG